MLQVVRPHSTGPLPFSPRPAAAPMAADRDPGLASTHATTPDVVDVRDLDREARHLFRLRNHGNSDRRSEDGWAYMFGADGLTFGDIVDVINPLQHLPVVSAVYRWLTGDTIAPAARMAGAALFGGPVGFAVAIANLAVEDASGRDLGDHAVALLFEGESGAEPTDVAAAPGPGLSLMPASAPTAAAMERAIDRYRARIGGGGDHGERRSVDRYV
ncbi:MAG: hypothetical protein WD014_00950 [Dongiaceae bacterium]